MLYCVLEIEKGPIHPPLGPSILSLCSEEVADDPLQAHVGDDGIGRKAEIVNQLVEGVSCLSPLGEDRLPLPIVHPGHGGDNGDGPGGARMDPVLGDLHNTSRDLPEACGDGAPRRVHRVYGDSGSF